MSKFVASQINAIAQVLNRVKPAEPTATERQYMDEAHYNVLLGRNTMHAEIMESLLKLLESNAPLFKETRFRNMCGYDDPS